MSRIRRRLSCDIKINSHKSIHNVQLDGTSIILVTIVLLNVLNTRSNRCRFEFIVRKS